jgi:Tautomerase enzyme
VAFFGYAGNPIRTEAVGPTCDLLQLTDGMITNLVGVDHAVSLSSCAHRTYRQIADDLNKKLGVGPNDLMLNMVFVEKEDWARSCRSRVEGFSGAALKLCSGTLR